MVTAMVPIAGGRKEEASGDDGLAEELGKDGEHTWLDLVTAAYHEEAAVVHGPGVAFGVGDTGRVELCGGGRRAKVVGKGTTSAWP